MNRFLDVRITEIPLTMKEFLGILSWVHRHICYPYGKGIYIERTQNRELRARSNQRKTEISRARRH